MVIDVSGRVEGLNCESLFDLKHLVVFDGAHTLPQVWIPFKDCPFILVICEHLMHTQSTLLRRLVPLLKEFDSV